MKKNIFLALLSLISLLSHSSFSAGSSFEEDQAFWAKETGAPQVPVRIPILENFSAEEASVHVPVHTPVESSAAEPASFYHVPMLEPERPRTVSQRSLALLPYTAFHHLYESNVQDALHYWGELVHWADFIYGLDPLHSPKGRAYEKLTSIQQAPSRGILLSEDDYNIFITYLTLSPDLNQLLGFERASLALGKSARCI